MCKVKSLAGQKSEKWRASHSAIKATLGTIPRKWSDGHRMQGLPPNKRCLELVDLTYQRHHLAQANQGALPNSDGYMECGILIDVSQDIRRSCYAHNHMRSLCSGSSIYCYDKDRMIVPLEHLAVLGWDIEKVHPKLPTTLTASKLRDLSGEAMALPCVTQALASLCLFVGGGVWSATQS